VSTSNWLRELGYKPIIVAAPPEVDDASRYRQCHESMRTVQWLQAIFGRQRPCSDRFPAAKESRVFRKFVLQAAEKHGAKVLDVYEDLCTKEDERTPYMCSTVTADLDSTRVPSSLYLRDGYHFSINGSLAMSAVYGQRYLNLAV